MINLPKLASFDFSGKKVILRMDLDLPEGNCKRLEAALPTFDFLKEKVEKITIIGHKGRPEGTDENLSLKNIAPKLSEIFKTDILFEGEGKFILKENLRFDKGEESNDPEFARKISQYGDVYVNEAFAVSHRPHASIVGLPKLLPHFAGLRFEEEIQNLSKVFENPQRPVMAIISGLKKDKLPYIDSFKKFADRVLVAGRLPEFLDDEFSDLKVTVAKLLPDKEDITIHSVEIFEKELESAKTILVSGPMGKFEEEGHRQGTERVLKAIAKLTAFKVAGGGDTENAISMFGLNEKFDWISVGGGAMLEFLANGTLPGIDALLE